MRDRWDVGCLITRVVSVVIGEIALLIDVVVCTVMCMHCTYATSFRFRNKAARQMHGGRHGRFCALLVSEKIARCRILTPIEMFS